MDEELKRYLEAMTEKMNDGQERLLDRMAALERDFRNAKGFPVGDALIASRRWLDLDARVSRLESRDRHASGE